MAVARFLNIGSMYTGFHFGGINSFTIDSATDEIAYTFQMPEDATITSFIYRVSSKTGSTNDLQYVATIEALNGSGAPSGTPLASCTWSPHADGNTAGNTYKKSFDAPVALTRGGYYCLHIKYASGTISGANNIAFSSGCAAFADRFDFPNPITTTDGGSSWNRGEVAGTAVFGLTSATQVYFYPFKTFRTASNNNYQNNRELGVRFILPGSGKFKLAGIQWIGSTGQGGTLDFISLYDRLEASGRTLLQQLTVDGDYGSGTGSFSSGRYTQAFWPDPLAELNFGQEYVIGWSSTGGVAHNMDYMEFDDPEYQKALPGGDFIKFCSRPHSPNLAAPPTASGADFISSSDELRRRPFLSLLISEVSPSSGGASPRPSLIIGGL